MKSFRNIAFAAIAALPFAAHAAPSRDYGLGDLGSLQIDLKQGWRVTQPPPDSGTTISIEAATPGRMRLLMTPLPTPQSDKDLRDATQHAADGIGPQSVEKTPAVKPLRGGEASGYYFKATDPAPKPGEYRYLYQGVVGLRSIIVTFTVLYNDGAERDAEDALSAVRALKLRAVPQGQSAL